jgi:ATP-dependent DNA helicase RecQ
LKGRFGLGMAVKMLAGSKEKTITRFRLDQLSTYGLLAEFNQEQVEKWIQELIGQGLIRQELAELGEKSYRVLLVTPRGSEAMKKMEKILLSPVPSAKKMEEIEHKGDYERDLFDELRKLRADLARAQGLPPYCIFQDRTLREMASRLPDTPEKMRSIVGVGEVTFGKYGPRFLEVIATYQEGRAS